ncbi:ankyrin repeat-containing domain protein [Pyronema domesticum]|nr:ankyrin repeat-containing domain protein [Pyronema domesticum]
MAFEEFAEESLIGYPYILDNDTEDRFPLLLFAAEYLSQFMHDADTGDSTEGDELWEAFSIMLRSDVRSKFIFTSCHRAGQLPRRYNDEDIDYFRFDKAITNALIAAMFLNLPNFIYRLVNSNSIEEIDFRIVDSDGFKLTALAVAVDCGYKSITHLLIEKGAEVNSEGGYYGNALQAAAMEDHKAIAKFLIERGAEVNAEGRRYGNALQAAAARGCGTMVELLVQRGADIGTIGGDHTSTLWERPPVSVTVKTTIKLSIFFSKAVQILSLMESMSTSSKQRPRKGVIISFEGF